MRPASTLAALLLALAACGVAPRAAAQLPVATGRQIAMSNAAWRLFIPSTYQHRPGVAADLVVHLHGDPQTVWNNAAYARLNAVIVTVNYSGLSSAYQTPFSTASLFQTILDEAQTRVRQLSDFDDAIVWDKVALSTFSAGYAGVREIFKSAAYRNRIDAYLAADSIHASTAGDGTPLDSHLVDFTTMANLAKNGSKTFILSHSQVPTSGYESTTEVANELLQNIGVAATAINQPGLGTLVYNRHAKAGNFELWGATGSDAAAHSRHLQYIGDFFDKLPLARLTNFAADFNKDGYVGATDFAIWRTAFGATAAGDANADGKADGADFLAWQRLHGSQPAAAASVVAAPEPSAARLLVTTALGALIAGRQRYMISSPSATLIGAAWLPTLPAGSVAEACSTSPPRDASHRALPSSAAAIVISS